MGKYTFRNGNKMAWTTDAVFLFVFDDRKNASGRVPKVGAQKTHGAIVEAYQQAHSKLCNC